MTIKLIVTFKAKYCDHCALFDMQNRTGEYIGHQYGNGSGPIWLDGVFCTGKERSLVECSHNNWGVHDCYYGDGVSIICSNGKCNTATAINTISC